MARGRAARRRRRAPAAFGAVLAAALAGSLGAALAARPAGAGEVALSFGDAPGGATGGFRIERREAGAKRFEVIALVGPGVADFVDRGLPAGASYCYRVRALAAEAESAWSPEVCAAAQEPEPLPEPAGTAAVGAKEGPAEASAETPPGEEQAAAGEGTPGQGEAPAAPGSEPGRRIRTSGGWLQVLD
jgi:hypothetical protein